MSPPRRGGASPIKRLQTEYKSSQNVHSSVIERLEPAGDHEDLFRWEAVIRGKGLGKGYDEGRWKLDIQVPQEYPNAPPKVRFVTRIVASNVDFEKGDICFDLLKDNWSAIYTLEQTVEAIAQLLVDPGVDSPLNIEVAKLIRMKDYVGAESLVRWACEEYKYTGR